jgi:serine/threonine protein kinase
VFKGLYGANDCVVKELIIPKGSDAKIVEEKRRELLEEAALMSAVKPHGSIATFYGVCLEEPHLCVVTELVKNTNLHRLLQSFKVSALDGVSLSRDLASGLQHLQRSRILHCDVAARNCLVVPDARPLRLKLCDFGLAIAVPDADTEWVENDDRPIPTRWSGPEKFQPPYQLHAPGSDVGFLCLFVSFRRHPFFAPPTAGRDVDTLVFFVFFGQIWSWGIVVWEIFNGGALPYPDIGTNQEVMDAVLRGQRMQLGKRLEGDNLLATLARLVEDSWEHKADSRPSFRQIAQKCHKLADAIGDVDVDSSGDDEDAAAVLKNLQQGENGVAAIYEDPNSNSTLYAAVTRDGKKGGVDNVSYVTPLGLGSSSPGVYERGGSKSARSSSGANLYEHQRGSSDVESTAATCSDSS